MSTIVTGFSIFGDTLGSNISPSTTASLITGFSLVGDTLEFSNTTPSMTSIVTGFSVYGDIQGITASHIDPTGAHQYLRLSRGKYFFNGVLYRRLE